MGAPDRLRALAAALLLALAAPAAADVTPQHGDPAVPLQPVVPLDPARLAGTWHEIARFPNRHQRQCGPGVAEYTLRDDGHVAVRGACPDLRSQRATVREGVARVEPGAELSIGLNSWLPVFRRSVVVLDLSEAEGVAVIGETRRKYGWVLARRPELARRAYDRAVGVLARNGYWVELLEPVAPLR